MAMSPWETILLAFGGNAILLAILGWLARSLLSQFLAKDLHNFESDLSLRTELATAELKQRLGMAAHEHNVRFTKLHERQSQVVEKIYDLILDFEDASAALALGSNDIARDLLSSALNRAEDARRSLSEYIRRHEIFIPEETSIQLQALLKRVNDLLSSCSHNLLDRMLADLGNDEYFPDDKEAWSAVHRYLENEAPLVRKSLEQEFRKHLGA
jgi:hypothetical protein